MRTRLSLDPRHSALLLVDFQEEQRRHADYSVAGFDRVIGNAAILLRAARASALIVVHTAYRRDFKLCPPRPFEPLAEDGTPAFSRATDPLTAICGELEPLDGEAVVYKNDASAFSEAKLQEILLSRAARWLIVAGVWTEACVAATIRDAIAGGFHVLLVKDACGSGTEAMHQTGILNIANRLYGGAVCDTATALRLIAGDAVDVWTPERPAPLLFTYADASEHYRKL
jgi:nicotinamidase-related amidase